MGGLYAGLNTFTKAIKPGLFISCSISTLSFAASSGFMPLLGVAMPMLILQYMKGVARR